ncbi:hypothetical protein Leryth_016274 [Lithospermum erythrorhizon]|nr:hypothetical protein Leryth_016274 [Lithospermum erythrorhizon]
MMKFLFLQETSVIEKWNFDQVGPSDQTEKIKKRECSFMPFARNPILMKWVMKAAWKKRYITILECHNQWPSFPSSNRFLFFIHLLPVAFCYNSIIIYSITNSHPVTASVDISGHGYCLHNKWYPGECAIHNHISAFIKCCYKKR